ncbi:MAG: S-adenosylmethionine:tRNA ribosyltransferase-isomerase [Prevotellaceae bacterium]|nr:S-adenosylmethionine:tRNA ribosyltransferase-isomerase [Prevotellaceae bacterium]
MDTKQIRIADYHYDLPDERIAKFPLAERDASKLLIYRHGTVTEDRFSALPDYLPAGALMVFNNTRVIQARLHFRKPSGALIEVFCMEPFSPLEYQQNFAQRQQVEWLCMIGNLKRWKEGVLTRQVEIRNTADANAPVRIVTLCVERLPHTENSTGTNHRVRFSWDADDLSFADILDAMGELPIPPYLNRETQESDKQTYQTVYSKIKGSVAAPTAGLHFTDRVLHALDAAGIDREELTLHVGAGTFKPVKSDTIADHEMHSEYIVVRRQTIEKLIRHGGEAIAVGTTSVRTLESLYYIGTKLATNPDATEDELAVRQWDWMTPKGNDIDTTAALQHILDYLDRHGLDALHTATQIMIAPGYEYKIVKRIVTNFHQPQSTLLLLVSAFVHGDWRTIYDYALTHDFRFLSYGDSSLLIP